MTGKDKERSRNGLIYGTTPEFAYIDSGKPWEASVKIESRDLKTEPPEYELHPVSGRITVSQDQ